MVSLAVRIGSTRLIDNVVVGADRRRISSNPRHQVI
jgi:hypothetical protein